MKTKITKVHHLPMCLGKWIFLRMGEQGLKAIIVSVDEEKQDGDKVYVYAENGIGIWDYKKAPCSLPYWGNPDNCYKILVLPEEISIAHHFAIEEGKIKDGDDIWIECVPHDEWLKENPPFGGPYKNQAYYQPNLNETHSIFSCKPFIVIR